VNDRQELVVRLTARQAFHSRGELALYPEGGESVERNPWIPVFLLYLMLGEARGR